MATSAPPRPASPVPTTDPAAPPEALIEEARHRQRRRRSLIVALALVAAVAAVSYFGAIHGHSSNTSGSASGPQRLCVRNVSSWQSRTVSRPGTPPALLLTNFHFGRVDYLYGHTDHELHWPLGGILISIANWTSAATKAMEPQYRPTSTLRIAASNFASFEGVSDLGQSNVRLHGQLLEVWVQARPTNASTIAAANRELANVQVCG
jgi:hypothetical protein